MRTLIDRIFKAGIKLCLLTGVAFTFAACYGPAPGNYWEWENEPEYQKDQEQVEQQLQDAPQKNVNV